MTGLSRRDFVVRAGALGVGAAGAVLAAGCAPPAAAPRPSPSARVGWLHDGLLDSYGRRLLDSFREGLRDLGYVEGQNILIEPRSSDGQRDRLPQLASELVSLPADLIVATGDSASQAAKQATSTIPIVMGISGDPVAGGLIASLARPGGNITGQSVLLQGITGKRLDLLKEALPAVARVGVLGDANLAPGRLHETQAAADMLGIEVVLLELRGPGDFDEAFQKATRAHVDALFPLEHAILVSHRSRVVEYAINSRLPGMYSSRVWVEAGGLMAYGANTTAAVRRAAVYVDKILKGAKPADLPVEQPMLFEFMVNLTTAEALGISFPESIRLQVTEVIR